jgi:acetylornithine aminotransferase
MTTATAAGSSGTGGGVGGGPGSLAPRTAGAALHTSGVIAQHIGAIVQQVRDARATLTQERAPNPSLKAEYEQLMARATSVRGKPLLYPFLGSGLGNGPLVELADGSVKWDMATGIGVHFFGHSDEDLIEASLRGAIDDTVKHGNLVSNFDAYAFGEELLRHLGKASPLKHAYISTSGAMANENALKVCFHRLYQRHAEGSNANDPAKLLAGFGATPRVLAFKDCFMGRSAMMYSIGDNHAGREGLPLVGNVDYMPFWDAAAAERMGPGASGKKRFIDMCLWHLDQYVTRYPGSYACFIFELVQGEGGFNVGDRDYFKALMEYCKAKKIAVWDDEIQTFGRTTRMFAYEHFDLGEYVDVFCVGKMTQACATAWTSDFNPKTNILSGTFTGEGSSFRVGTRVLQRLASGQVGGTNEEGTFYGEQGSFAKHHALFREHAAALIAKHPSWFPVVRELGESTARLADGIGGMMRLTPFGGDKKKVMDACKHIFDEGAIVFYCGHGPYHIRMLPPMPVMREEHWGRVFGCIERGLARIA